MEGDNFSRTKKTLLSHVEVLFEEIEQETVMSHQEKYALLEDVLDGATDVDELRVAFDQWYAEHAEDIGFEHESHEIWGHALAIDVEEDDDSISDEDDTDNVLDEDDFDEEIDL